MGRDHRPRGWLAAMGGAGVMARLHPYLLAGPPTPSSPRTWSAPTFSLRSPRRDAPPFQTRVVWDLRADLHNRLVELSMRDIDRTPQGDFVAYSAQSVHSFRLEPSGRSGSNRPGEAPPGLDVAGTTVSQHGRPTAVRESLALNRLVGAGRGGRRRGP